VSGGSPNRLLHRAEALDHNRRAWDFRARIRAPYVDTASESDFQDPLRTACPRGWLGPDVRGMKILCLAAGGGRHGPLLAAAQADVTVLDLSPEMLALDRQVSARRNLSLRVFEGSMDDLSCFENGSFDAVFQPVSSCYLPKLDRLFAEVARVLKAGGLYLSQHKQPSCLQAGSAWDERAGGYVVKTHSVAGMPLPAEGPEALHREAGTSEFLHRLQDILGGICRAGMVIEAAVEPRRGHPDFPKGSFEHRSSYLPPFLALKARRVLNSALSPHGSDSTELGKVND